MYNMQKITMMDVEKQSNGFDCGWKIARSHVFLFWVSVLRNLRAVELHCSCRMPEEKGHVLAECDVCHVWYHRHCMDIPSEVFDFTGNVKDVF